MLATPPLRAVTFDFWNTVMWEEPGSLKAQRLELWAGALDDAGVAIHAAALERAHDAAHNTYEHSWRAGRQFTAEEAAAQIAGQLEGGVPADVAAILLEGYGEAGLRAAVHPSSGVAECLARLKDAGVRLGIVCDIGLTPSPVVRELLARDGLLSLFDGMTFSDEVGHYKPAAAIFEHALGALGDVPPDAAAHVGDRRRTDVAGALGLGMTAIRYNGVYEDEATSNPEADIVIDDLARLPDLLGIYEIT